MTQRNSGSALIYILVAIALIALLTTSMMEPSNQQGQAQNASNLVSEMQSQISLIDSAIQECITMYPDQDSELTATQQKNPPYPINPADSYFNTQSAVPGAASLPYVKHIRCPGNPGGSGPTNQNHALIFGGSSGRFLPPAVNLFSEWHYYNGADGVFIMAATTKTDAFVSSALTKLDQKYSPCQAEFIDASSTVNLSSDTVPVWNTATCTAGNKCFRYWLIRKPSAVPTDTSCNN